MYKNNTLIISNPKHLTVTNNTLNMVSCCKNSTPRECNSKDLLEKGASAPLGIALFLCQKSIFMMGVTWESLGLPVPFSRFANPIYARRPKNCNLTRRSSVQEKGKDHAPPIQHSSSHQSATPQNPSQKNSNALHAHQKQTTNAQTQHWSQRMKTKALNTTNIAFQYQRTSLLSSYDSQNTCWFYLDDLMQILNIEHGKKTIAKACDIFICRTENDQLWLNEAGLSFIIFTSDIKDELQNHLMNRIFDEIIYPFRQSQMGEAS